MDAGTPNGILDEPLSIAHVLAPAPAGGLESVVEGLAAGQRRDGHAAHVVTVLGTGEARPPLLDRLAELSVPTIELRVEARAYLGERRDLARVLDRLRPDIVHTHGYRCDVVDAPVARARGTPTVSTVHGFTGGGVLNRIYERLQERALRRHDAVVAVSRPLVERLARRGVRRERIHLLPNALPECRSPIGRDEARARLGLGASEFVVGWVGRLSAEKGPDVAIAAWEKMRNARIALSIIGDGPMLDGLRRGRGARDGAAPLRFHGLVPGAAALLGAFDVLLLSSWTEGTPIILLEAMAAGVPIVATAVGGVPDVVSAEEALLVPSGEPDAIARAVLATRDDPDRAASRVEAARARVRETFGTRRWLDRYDEIYRSVRAAPSRRGVAHFTSNRDWSRAS